MIEVKYHGYLTEDKLEPILGTIFVNVISQHKIKLDHSYVKVDYFIPEINMVIEFDGDHHYRKSKTIQRDLNLKNHCAVNNLKLAQIPYWLQFDDRIAHWLFGDEIYNKYINGKVSIISSYPHGFISNNCVLPAEFSILGWNRFADEYSSLAKDDKFSVMQEVYSSIQDKISKLGFMQVLGDDDLHQLTPHLFNSFYPT